MNTNLHHGSLGLLFWSTVAHVAAAGRRMLCRGGLVSGRLPLVVVSCIDVPFVRLVVELELQVVVELCGKEAAGRLPPSAHLAVGEAYTELDGRIHAALVASCRSLLLAHLLTERQPVVRHLEGRRVNLTRIGAAAWLLSAPRMPAGQGTAQHSQHLRRNPTHAHTCIPPSDRVAFCRDLFDRCPGPAPPNENPTAFPCTPFSIAVVDHYCSISNSPMSLRQLARAAGPVQAWRALLLRGPLLSEASSMEGNRALSSLAAFAATASRRPPHDWAGSGALHLAARSFASQAAQTQTLPSNGTQEDAKNSRSSSSAAAQAQAAAAEAARQAAAPAAEAGWPLDDPSDCSMCDARAPFDEEAAAAAAALGQHRLGTRPIPTADAPNEQAGHRAAVAYTCRAGVCGCPNTLQLPALGPGTPFLASSLLHGFNLLPAVPTPHSCSLHALSTAGVQGGRSLRRLQDRHLCPQGAP